MGSYEKSETEDLLKLDGRNLVRVVIKLGKAQKSLGFLINQGPELVPRLE